MLEAIGLPFWFKVQVPAPVILAPISLMTNVAFEFRSQLAVIERVGPIQVVDAVAVPTLPPPEAVRTSVPKRPLVFTLVDRPALSWNELVAMGVPFKNRVHEPALVISPPLLVMVNVPFAAGVQEAVTDKLGAA